MMTEPGLVDVDGNDDAKTPPMQKSIMPKNISGQNPEQGDYQPPPAQKKKSGKGFGCCCGGFLAAVGLFVILLIGGGYYAFNKVLPAEPLSASTYNISSQQKKDFGRRLELIKEQLENSSGTFEFKFTQDEMNLIAEAAKDQKKSLEVLDFTVTGDKLKIRISDKPTKQLGRYLNIVFSGNVTLKDKNLSITTDKLSLGNFDFSGYIKDDQAGADKICVEYAEKGLDTISKDFKIDIEELQIKDGRVIVRFSKATPNAESKENDSTQTKEQSGLDT